MKERLKIVKVKILLEKRVNNEEEKKFDLGRINRRVTFPQDRGAREEAIMEISKGMWQEMIRQYSEKKGKKKIRK